VERSGRRQRAVQHGQPASQRPPRQQDRPHGPRHPRRRQPGAESRERCYKYSATGGLHCKVPTYKVSVPSCAFANRCMHR
jgi:hypothetical protein